MRLLRTELKMRALWFFQTVTSSQNGVVSQKTWIFNCVLHISYVDHMPEATPGTDCSCDTSCCTSAVLIFCHIIVFIYICIQISPFFYTRTAQWDGPVVWGCAPGTADITWPKHLSAALPAEILAALWAAWPEDPVPPPDCWWSCCCVCSPAYP